MARQQNVSGVACKPMLGMTRPSRAAIARSNGFTAIFGDLFLYGLSCTTCHPPPTITRSKTSAWSSQRVSKYEHRSESRLLGLDNATDDAKKAKTSPK